MMLSALLLLGIAVCALSETCPSKEELILSPCDCIPEVATGRINVTCTDGKLRELKRVFKTFAGKKGVYLNLVKYDLGAVPSDLFDGIKLYWLGIYDSDLHSLADKDQPVLDGLKDSLEVLEITSSFNHDVDITELNLEHLQKLWRITLSHTTTKKLGNDWFGRELSLMHVIDLHENEIEELGDTAFAKLPRLKTLYLQNNQIRAIKRSMLPTSASQLRFLDFSFNPLTSLPEDIFSNMPILESVRLRDTDIARVEQKAWEPVWEQLNYVSFFDNPLECDSHMNWLFDLITPKQVYGSCVYPRAKKGLLMNFIKNRGRSSVLEEIL